MKKYFGIGLVALLLAAAVWWSVSENGAEADMTAATHAAETPGGEALGAFEDGLAAPAAAGLDFYQAYREEREATRTLELQYLDEIIATASSDSETLEDALSQKLALVENMEKEFAIETQIRAKGFSDAAVTFHPGAVSVVVDCAELTGEEAAQILDIVMRETGERAENIKIVANAA